ncbi:MAG: glycosyltransferase [Candidatus Omnitrophica bacterium CG11_big_fil_rev_8_21_14_0_20_43_6]|nr:MAG: glycosyltransferase [Candidatus Omnitrophica bacterium CG11_big_fil_rev_8_21_14_0_20_43_6]
MQTQTEKSAYLSVVVPFFNEAENIDELYSQLIRVLRNLNKTYELIFVDDGSRDTTFSKLSALYDQDHSVKVIKLGRNYGQSFALAAGFDQAQGEIIISMDGDLQHNPEEIPEFISQIEKGYEVVSGWRQNRKDNFLTRRLPSFIANLIIARISGVKLHDFGTTFKAYRKKVIKSVRLYGELHRFIPVLISYTGASMVEIPIKSELRNKGKSNYGLSRILKVMLDIIAVNFITKYIAKPLYIFGLIGLFFLGTGFAVILFLTIGWLYFGLNMVENRGILLLGILCVITSVQFITSGLIAEIICRIYYESQDKKPYFVKEIKTRE